jgi:hypothetical protein
MRKLIIAVSLVFLLVFMASAVAAKDLTNRVGVGYNNQLNFNFLGGQDASITSAFISSQSISAKYWFTENLGIEPMFGYLTAKNKEIGGWAAEIAAKVLYNLNKEENMNFYGGGGLGLLPMKIDYGPKTETDTGFEAMAFLGVEFFLPGLPNLGFDVEFGLKYIDVDTFAQISTYGGGFGVLGIRYYF